jgi:AraC-like DNA-binding protein
MSLVRRASTTQWDTVDQVARWISVMTDLFAPIDLRVTEPPFTADIAVRDIGPVQASELRTSACSFLRSEQEVAAGVTASVQIVLAAEGRSEVEQMGRTAVLAPGDVVLLEPLHPCSVTFSAECRSLSLQIPRNLLLLGTAELVDLVGVRLRSPLAAATAGLVEQLIAEDVELSAAQDSDCSTALVKLCSALIRDLRAGRSDDEPGMLDAVKHYVDRNLGDPTLTPRTVARAVHVSVRYLYRLFEDEPETLSARVRRLRLERARDDLANPDLAGLTVTEIAGRWGIHNVSRFGQAFKKSYGQTPSEYRRAHSVTTDTHRH